MEGENKTMENLNFFGKGLKKLTPFVLTGTIMATMVACGKEEKDNVLDGTILEDTIVATTTDGNSYLVKPLSDAYILSKCKNNYHYEDVISGNYYHLMDGDDNKCSVVTCINVDFETMEPISLYLTKEELLKDDFTEKEIVDIIDRAVISQQLEEIQKTKVK